jgi:dTDP-4-dehydrorhamnose reductase
MKILIIGASGMLGSALFRFLSYSANFDVYGAVRSGSIINLFDQQLRNKLIINVDISDFDSLINLHNSLRPNLVINCVGVVKQLEASFDPLTSIPINSLLPHRLAKLTQLIGARFIHISTDCVFSGAKGYYNEADIPDADDLYGRTKLLGEVDYSNSVTLRTSIIGHELQGKRSLIDWFLSESGTVSGYRNAIFSGLPTVELARVIQDFVIPNPNLSGLFHVSVEPISKYDLLKLVADQYKKAINIIPDDSIKIDRSLNSEKFRLATGFNPKTWPMLISEMSTFG